MFDRGMLAGWLIAGLALSGCQAPPDVKQLQDENKALQGQLQRANQQVNSLQAQERLLQKDIEELNNVIGVLGTEKSLRIEESATLRSQVRLFVQRQIDLLKDFLVLGDLLDYVGGELVERSSVDEKPLLLVDLANPIPKAGTLTGLGAHLTKPVSLTVKVLRPLGKRLVVIWESRPIDVKRPGINKLNFPVSVGVEKGDILAYYFPRATAVSFDSGTGDTRFSSGDINLGNTISEQALAGGRERRAYSIGVYGLLD